MDSTQFSNRKRKKRERFLRVAQRRTRNALRCIRLIAKCANKSSYEYTPGEVEKIFSALQDAMQQAKIGFKRDQVVKFSLSREGVQEQEDSSEEEV